MTIAAVEKKAKESEVVISVLMMPEHANHFGNVHGGILMKLSDEAAAIAAMRHAARPAVTVAMDSMTFRQPVHIGHLVTFRARVTYVSRSSMEVRVLVTAEDPITGAKAHTNRAHLVFVALDDQGRPTPVSPLLLEDDESKKLFEAGKRRQAHRLKEQKSAI